MNFNYEDNEISKEKWFSFYINTGRLFYEKNKEDNGNLNLFISTSFLNYIAAGIGVGISDRIFSTASLGEGKDIIKKIQPGTLVLYRPPSSKQEETYTFEGLNKDGHPEIKSTGKNPTTLTLTRPKLWKNIRIAPEQTKYKRNRTFKTSDLYKKVYERYDKEHVNNILRESKINLLFVGNERRLKAEIGSEFKSGHSPAEWILPRTMNGVQSSFISDIVTTGSDLDSLPLDTDTILIFDGVQAFIQSWHKGLKNACIILFERTATVDSLFDGLDSLDTALDSKSVTEAKDFIDTIKSFPEIPQNIELTAWRQENYD